MKITSEQVKSAYDRLTHDSTLSIRKLARELNVCEGALRSRLKKYLGTQYLFLTPPTGSLLKLLRQEILPRLDHCHRDQVTQWINQNQEVLAQDSGLLSEAQEDRLTFNECVHKRSLDEMIPLSEFLNNRIQEGFTYVPFNESFLPAPHHSLDEPNSPSSYIDISDLEEVLSDYFKGSLDELPPKLIDRLYLPCS